MCAINIINLIYLMFTEKVIEFKYRKIFIFMAEYPVNKNK